MQTANPDYITVQLIANGTTVPDKTLTLNSDNQWKGSFTELPKYQKGKEIVYSIGEVKLLVLHVILYN